MKQLYGWEREYHAKQLTDAANWRFCAKAWPKSSHWVEFKEKYIRRARIAVELARSIRMEAVR